MPPRVGLEPTTFELEVPARLSTAPLQFSVFDLMLKDLILFFKTSFFISKILCFSYIIFMVIENIANLTLPVTFSRE